MARRTNYNPVQFINCFTTDVVFFAICLNTDSVPVIDPACFVCNFPCLAGLYAAKHFVVNHVTRQRN